MRETGAAVGALVAYLVRVLPRARRELRQLGPPPASKVKNAEAVAVFATLAPRPAAGRRSAGDRRPCRPRSTSGTSSKSPAETLPDLVPTLVYVTLAPFLDAREAYEVAIG